MGGLVGGLLGKTAKPAPIAEVPAAPTRENINPADTSSAVSAQATPQGGRASNIVAGTDTAFESNDPNSVRKKLLGQ